MNSETDEDHVHQNNTTSFTASDGITWDISDPIKKNPEHDLAAMLSQKLLSHLLKHIVVLSKNRFAVHGIYSLMKVCCVIYKDVPKKKLEEFYKQTITACRCMN